MQRVKWPGDLCSSFQMTSSLRNEFLIIPAIRFPHTHTRREEEEEEEEVREREEDALDRLQVREFLGWVPVGSTT